MKQNNILENSGLWILGIFSATPLLLWIFTAPLIPQISNLNVLIISMGNVAGLCGFAMFSLVIILSSRLKIFDKLFRGINESYTVHHTLGGLAFCLLLFHPLLLAFGYFSTSFKGMAQFLLPGAYWSQNFGIIGLSLMIAALVITFYAKLKYQIWKFTHKFMGVAFIFAFLHTFLIGSDVASNQPLKIYLFILGIAAIIAYFYRTLFPNFLVQTYGYAVKNVKAFEDKIWEIEFAPAGGNKISFNAGQFAFIKFYSKALSKELHPFSFSSAPGQPLRIAIKESGDYTNKISGLKAGDFAKFEGPFGVFNFQKYSNKKQIWIAGGVGITPFLSMLRSLPVKDSDYKIDLYYSAKNENCFAFKREIEEISRASKNLNVKFWDTSKEKFISADAICKTTQDFLDRDIFVCGPPVLMQSLKTQFLKFGFFKKNIHIEEFQLY